MSGWVDEWMREWVNEWMRVKLEYSDKESSDRHLDIWAALSKGDAFNEPAEMTRRSMLGVLGASAALAAGIPGCRRKPERKIVSRISGPEYQQPGEVLYYASTWTEGNFPYGMLVKTVDGRPIKIEGNPDHPINQGKSSAAMQASILSLYDPERLKKPRRGEQEISWAEADEQMVAALSQAQKVILMTRSNLGSAQQMLIAKFREVCPAVQHFVYEPMHDMNRREAWKVVYDIGDQYDVLEPDIRPRYDKAEVILSLDCDFLGTDGVVLRAVREFAGKRKPEDDAGGVGQMSRLYVVESNMSITGSNADHRIRLRPSQMEALAGALPEAVQGDESKLHDFAEQNQIEVKILMGLVSDLKAQAGKSLVVAGGHLPVSVHLLVAQLNERIQARGNTLVGDLHGAIKEVSDFDEISREIAGGVDVLICLDVNPVYDWPGGGFRELLSRVKLSVGHGMYADETVSSCTLSLPSNHNLESWNDATSQMGLYSLCQPVIGPLYDTRQGEESVLTWVKRLQADDQTLLGIQDWHDYIKDYWRANYFKGQDDFEKQWQAALQKGIYPQTTDGSLQLPATAPAKVTSAFEENGPYELLIVPHHSLYDGRFSHNAWLQELPDPVSKLVWDNAAVMSPATALELEVEKGDVVEIKANGGTVALPVLVQAGVADKVVVVTMGQGREKAGAAGSGVGVNAAVLMAGGQRICMTAEVTKTGEKQKLVQTQRHFSMEGRPIVLDGTLAEYRADEHFIEHKRHKTMEADIYPGHDYSRGHKWAMGIDLSKCIGCGTCVMACQAENNIAVVGKDQCERGRLMHWLRIDRYQEGAAGNPTVYFQPMLCQHCDNAPCENVCPVNATVHGDEGLNEMVYNRCVGTRYCSNNCPYKVRRFNFFDYRNLNTDDPVRELRYNPQVTVRSRGVMEKCTFCLQRINEVKFKAKNRREPMADGSLQTACQQACPAGAIVFGDVNDPDSEIVRWRDCGRAYRVLEEINVKPNVTYLAKVRNPKEEV